MRTSSIPPPKRRVVMIVEDDEEMMTLLTEVLSTVALVKRAKDGQEAFDYMNSSALPDLLITDVMMPRMTGIQLVKNMKTDPRMKLVPVIMLTAKSSPLDHVMGINAGARHYLTKPINQVELLNKVVATLGIKR